MPSRLANENITHSHGIGACGSELRPMRLPLCLTLIVTMAPALIDTKLLGRPKSYSGARGEWGPWKLVFISYIGALSPALLARLQHAERQPSPLPLSALSDDEKAEACTLNYVLAQALSGSNLQMLMNVGECNGYEGWRHLVHREEPTAGKQCTSWSTDVDLEGPLPEQSRKLRR